MTYLWTHRWRLIERLIPMGLLSRLWVNRDSMTALRLFCWFRGRAYHEGELEAYEKAGLLE